MKGFTKEYRISLSDKLMDLGNLAIGGLVFGQFLTDKTLSFLILCGGLIFMFFCYFISYNIGNKK